jgi:Ca2+-dependent lipid-binding protein
VVITVWDWDVGDDDDLIGDVKVPLAPLLEGKHHEESYHVLGT